MLSNHMIALFLFFFRLSHIPSYPRNNMIQSRFIPSFLTAFHAVTSPWQNAK